MTIRVDHTAVVVADMVEALERWTVITGGSVGMRTVVPEQHVEVSMVRVGDTTIELIQPDESESGVRRFLESRGEAIHHIGLLVDDIESTMKSLSGAGFQFIDAHPRSGAEGRVAFMQPRSSGGVLLELIEREGL